MSRPLVFFAPFAFVVPLVAFGFSPREARADEAPPAPAAPAPEDALPPRPPRPPLPEVPESVPPPWSRHVDIGVDLAFVTRLAQGTSGGTGADVSYEPTVGFGLHARWLIFEYLGFTAYYVDSKHDVTLPPGALSLGGALSVEAVETYAFGARLTPTWPVSERLRLWLAAGIGWGRLELGRMQVTPDAGGPYEVRQRADSFVEVPLGLGGSYEVWPRWLNLELELVGSFALDQEDASWRGMQAVDAEGGLVAVGPMPPIEGSFVGTLGLSLLL
jgi:hypothetical protein